MLKNKGKLSEIQHHDIKYQRPTIKCIRDKYEAHENHEDKKSKKMQLKSMKIHQTSHLKQGGHGNTSTY